MPSSSDVHSAHPHIARWRLPHPAWLAAPAVIVSLIAYCELHSVVVGGPSVGLDVSTPWAIKVAFGWMAAAFMLQRLVVRFPESVRRHPQRIALGAALGVTVLTLLSELWLTDVSDVVAFLYQRTPLHLLLGGVLIALLGRGTQPARAPVTAESPAAADPGDALLEVMTGTGRTSIRVGDIESLEADGNYLSVHHSNGRSFLLRQTLTWAEQSLPAPQFTRIHRSTIVNRHMIRERRSGDLLLMNSGRTLKIGRAYRERADRECR